MSHLSIYLFFSVRDLCKFLSRERERDDKKCDFYQKSHDRESLSIKNGNLRQSISHRDDFINFMGAIERVGELLESF